MTPQACLLVALSRSPLDAEQVTRGLRALGDPATAEGFLEYAAAHRLLGRTLVTLADYPGHVPTGIDTRVADLLRRTRRRAAVFELKRDAVLQTLAQRNVPAVVLKGGALAGTLYSDAALRDLEDLDLLVSPDRWRDAVRALASIGYVVPHFAELRAYRRYHFHVPVDHPDEHCVEVHWSLTRPGSALRLAADAILAEASFDRSVPVPRSETMVLHLVIQNVQESFSRLARLVDVDRILRAERSFDWERFIDLAVRGGLSTAAAVTLRLASIVLGSPVPAATTRALCPAPIARAHLAMLRPVERLFDRRAANESDLAQLLQLWLLPRSAERIAHVLELLRLDRGAAVLRGDRPTSIRRALRVTRIAVRQLAVYGDGALAWTTHGGRSQMRFWSSHASSSDRL